MKATISARTGLFMISILSLVLLLFSCSQKAVHMDEPIVVPSPDHKEVKVYEPQPSSPEELRTAYFDYDQSNLKPSAIEALRFDVEWLRKHPDANVQIEGHCDERGTREYNLRLGQERAEAAKDFLLHAGIAPSRVSTISYGALPGQTPKSWASNRKALFVVFYATSGR